MLRTHVEPVSQLKGVHASLQWSEPFQDSVTLTGAPAWVSWSLPPAASDS